MSEEAIDLVYSPDLVDGAPNRGRKHSLWMEWVPFLESIAVGCTRSRTSILYYNIIYIGWNRKWNGVESVVRYSPFKSGNGWSSTSCELRYLELPWDFFVFFFKDLFAKGSILSTNAVVDIVSTKYNTSLRRDAHYLELTAGGPPHSINSLSKKWRNCYTSTPHQTHPFRSDDEWMISKYQWHKVCAVLQVHAQYTRLMTLNPLLYR